MTEPFLLTRDTSCPRTNLQPVNNESSAGKQIRSPAQRELRDAVSRRSTAPESNADLFNQIIGVEQFDEFDILVVASFV